MKSPKKKKVKKFDIDRSARWTIGGAIFLTLAALWVVPMVWSGHPNLWNVYNQNTGVVGDTIGGIAGPILNFAGLIIVYYTLREQIKTNENQFEQIRAETKRAQNESFFDLTYKIIERFSETVERQKRLFAEIPEIGFGIRRGNRVTSSEGMGATKPARQDELLDFRRQFFTLTQFFGVISRRIEGESLTGEQKVILLDLLDVTYGDRLGNAVSDYQRLFGSAQIEEQPDDMYTDFQEQSIRLFQLREQVEAQAKTESIPFGDTED
ncbi:hypothetical protein [Hymenobacter sp. IS2118]|uniref:hypothetical protein n=1 Tax=Hymenobacter sp. IS2118 TaxID=1505605 RepID=UPI000553C0B1|nr:hypothetical protein [Hymenobacter sp. IS2118]